jgi:aminoglycoside phosphotransferase
MSDNITWLEVENEAEMLDWLTKISVQNPRIVCLWPEDSPELQVVAVVEDFSNNQLTYKFGIVHSRSAADTLWGACGIRVLWFTVLHSKLEELLK